MNKLLIAGAALLLLVGSAVAKEAAPGAAAAAPAALISTDLVGKAAPAFTLKDTAGKQVKLADYKGKIVVLDWYNHGCPIVQAYYAKPEFVSTMNTALQGQKDVVWLSVVSSAPGNQGSDVAEFKTTSKQYGKVNTTLWDSDGKVGRAYGASATPTVYVIGKDGKVVYAGAFDQAAGPQEAPKGTNLAIAAVKAARAGKAPAVTSTKPFGCSVKYASK